LLSLCCVVVVVLLSLTTCAAFLLVDEELFISQFLGQLKLEEDTLELLKGVEEDKAAYEKKILALDREEREKQQLISELTSQRQLVAREASKATGQYRETKEELKIKNLILADLDKQVHETSPHRRLSVCICMVHIGARDLLTFGGMFIEI